MTDRWCGTSLINIHHVLDRAADRQPDELSDNIPGCQLATEPSSGIVAFGMDLRECLFTRIFQVQFVFSDCLSLNVDNLNIKKVLVLNRSVNLSSW